MFHVQSVEDWRDLLSSMANQLNTTAGDQTEFMLAWIDIESKGYPCSWGCAGTGTGLCSNTQPPVGNGEVGIFQLEDPDNLARAGTTYAAQHPQPPCPSLRGQNYSGFSSLSPSQQQAQAQAGINYINYCIDYARTQLASAGTTWDETQSDFWRLVKLVHAAPACVRNGVANFNAMNGGPPQTWSDVSGASGCPTGWLSSPDSVGAYGGGAPDGTNAPDPSIIDQIAVNTGGPLLQNWLTLGTVALAGLVLGWGIQAFVSRRANRRVGHGA